MLKVDSKKSGYTLVEVLVVVSIIGILSSIGVVSLRDAVANARVKDCALNTTAFLERVANEASRLSKPLCVKRLNAQTLAVYETNSCNDLPEILFDSFVIEAPASFDCGADFGSGQDIDGPDWAAEGGLFEPRIGLSALPANGFVCVQYGNESNYGVAVKSSDNNRVIPMWNIDGLWNQLQ